MWHPVTCAVGGFGEKPVVGMAANASRPTSRYLASRTEPHPATPLMLADGDVAYVGWAVRCGAVRCSVHVSFPFAHGEADRGKKKRSRDGNGCGGWQTKPGRRTYVQDVLSIEPGGTQIAFHEHGRPTAACPHLLPLSVEVPWQAAGLAHPTGWDLRAEARPHHKKQREAV